MKLTTLVVAISALLFSSFSIQQDKDYQPFALAMKTGNAKALSEYFDEQVELTIQGGEFSIQNNYSKVQTENILSTFFKKAHVKSFDVKHPGQHNWFKYIIGYLETETGKYRTLIKYMVKDDQLIIQEVELTLEDGK